MQVVASSGGERRKGEEGREALTNEKYMRRGRAVSQNIK